MRYAPRLGERVHVVSGPYAGHFATVVRMLHRRTSESWCDLDPTHDGAAPPDFPFPADDPYGRGRHALVRWADMQAPV